MAGRKLPENSRVISAVNDGDEYQLTDLDPALVSRFNIYDFRPSAEEWLLWASQNKIDERIISFLEENPNYLEINNIDENSEDLEKTPDRRAWVRVLQIIENEVVLKQIHKKIISGIVGMKATSQFFHSLSNQKIISGKDLIFSYSKHKTAIGKYQLHEFSVLNESIFRYIESVEWKNDDKEKAIENIQKYTDFLLKNQKNEAFAHFVSIFEKNIYPKTMLFFVSEMPFLYQEIQKFILSM